MAIVTAQEVAAYAGIGNKHEDNLSVAIDDAQGELEDFCNRQFEDATRTEYHDSDGTDTFIYVLNPPVNSVTSLTMDAQDTATAVAAANYVTYEKSGKVQLFNDETVFSAGPQATLIVYRGGWTAANMPNALKFAVKQYAIVVFDRREPGVVQFSADGVNLKYDGESIPMPIQARLFNGGYVVQST